MPTRCLGGRSRCRASGGGCARSLCETRSRFWDAGFAAYLLPRGRAFLKQHPILITRIVGRLLFRRRGGPLCARVLGRERVLLLICRRRRRQRSRRGRLRLRLLWWHGHGRRGRDRGKCRATRRCPTVGALHCDAGGPWARAVVAQWLRHRSRLRRIARRLTARSPPCRGAGGLIHLHLAGEGAREEQGFWRSFATRREGAFSVLELSWRQRCSSCRRL